MKKSTFILGLCLLLAGAVWAEEKPINTYKQDYETLQQSFESKMGQIKSKEEYQSAFAQYKKDLEALLTKYEKEVASDDLELWRCEILSELERFDEALVKADTLIAKDSPLADRVGLMKAGILLQKEKFAEAVAVFRKIEGKVPPDEDYYGIMLGLVMAGKDPKVRKEFGEKFLAAELPKGMEQRKAMVKATIDQLALVGKPAPSISAAKWLNSEALTLESLKGKAVVIDFWAPWCAPCRQVIPHLVKAYEELKGKGLVVIGYTRYYGMYRDDIQNKGKVSADEEFNLIKEFLGRQKITYAIAVADKGDVFGAYFVTGIPTMVLIDKSGQIIDIKVGAGDEAALRQDLEKFLQ